MFEPLIQWSKWRHYAGNRWRLNAGNSHLVVKQDDVTRLNQEGARLVADLSHARQGLYDQQLQLRQLASQLAASQELAQQAGVLASQMASKDEHLAALRAQVESATGNAETLSARVRALELALATSQATLASQQEIAAALRAHLASRKNKGQIGPVDSAS